MSVTPQGAVYTLDTLDWSASVGGRHLTGKLHWYEGEPKSDQSHSHFHELERDLTAKDAKLLDPEDGRERWQLGGRFRKSNRFETRAQLERWAAHWVKADCERRGEPVWLLIEDDTCNPRRPVAAQGWDKDRLKLMTSLADLWDKTPDHLRDFNSEGIKAIYRMWGTLLREPGSMGGDIKASMRGLGQLKRVMKTLAKR